MADLDKMLALPVFYNFSDDELKLLLQCGSEEQHDADSVILEEAGHHSDLYVILEGRVAVEMGMPSAMDKKHVERISTINAEHVFGEISFIEGTPRSAQIRALEDVKVLKLDSAKSHLLFEEHPIIGFKMMRNLAVIVCDRLKNTNMMWRDIVTRSW